MPSTVKLKNLQPARVVEMRKGMGYPSQYIILNDRRSYIGGILVTDKIERFAMSIDEAQRLHDELGKLLEDMEAAEDSDDDTEPSIGIFDANVDIIRR